MPCCQLCAAVYNWSSPKWCLYCEKFFGNWSLVFWLSVFWERSLSVICLPTNFQTDISSANKLKLSQAFTSLISLPSDLQSPTICYYSAERKQRLYFLRKHLHHHRWPGDNRKTAIFLVAFSIHAVCLSASSGKYYFRMTA